MRSFGETPGKREALLNKLVKISETPVKREETPEKGEEPSKAQRRFLFNMKNSYLLNKTLRGMRTREK